MKLKRERPIRTVSRSVRGFFAGQVFLILAYTGVVFLAGAYTYHNSTDALRSLRKLKLSSVGNYVRGLQVIPEHLTIDIKHKHMMRLASARRQALERGILITSNDDTVPARIRHGDKSVEAKVRLKGNLGDHWEDDKWSFRVVIKGDNTLFGMKQFSLQHPRTRGFIYEWLYHKALRREDVLGLRYEFVGVTINGVHKGVYALEEHFEKRLIENNKRREGPILRFNEDLIWSQLAQQDDIPVYERRGLSSAVTFDATHAESYGTTDWLAQADTADQHLAAVSLLESFRNGRRRTSEVFDVARLAKFFAITDLLGATHGARHWANSRYYFNPVVGRLEPIGFDGFDREPVEIQRLSSVVVGDSAAEDAYLDRLFQDDGFAALYLQELQRVSQSEYLEKFLEEVDDDLQRNLSILHRESTFEFSDQRLIANARFIRLVLDPPEAIHAFLRSVGTNFVDLDIGNVQEIPVELVSLVGRGREAVPEERIIVPGKRDAQPVRYVSARIPLSMDGESEPLQDGGLLVKYTILGLESVKSTNVIPWPSIDEAVLDNDVVSREPNVWGREFIHVDENARTIEIKTGYWTLDDSLIVPPGYTLIARAGTTLDLSNSALLLSFSPIRFLGLTESPVVIKTTDSTGQGMVVIDGKSESLLANVVFENLTSPAQRGWQLTGAVTFYQSPIVAQKCHFLGARCEDALNVIRSTFRIEECLFENSTADSLDADFTDGVIKNSSFAHSGNDAMDVSGTSLRVEDVVVKGAGDKAISVGEASRMIGKRIVLDSCEIAVAAKDSSQIRIAELKVKDCRVGFSAFQKKPEFSGAQIEVDRLDLSDSQEPYLIQIGSDLKVDGESRGKRIEQVEALLYGVQYGKASR